MMQQKDFIVRQMEMIGPAIMYMLGIWKDGRMKEAIEYGAENLENFTDLPLTEIDQIHQDVVVEYLSKEKAMAPGLIRVVSEFLFQIGKIRHQEGHPNGRETLLKARNLLEWYEKDTQVYSFDIASMKEEIEYLLTNFVPPN